MKCPSIHKWSGKQCSLESEHDGYCCGRMIRAANERGEG